MQAASKRCVCGDEGWRPPSPALQAPQAALGGPVGEPWQRGKGALRPGPASQGEVQKGAWAAERLPLSEESSLAMATCSPPQDPRARARVTRGLLAASATAVSLTHVCSLVHGLVCEESSHLCPNGPFTVAAPRPRLSHPQNPSRGSRMPTHRVLKTQTPSTSSQSFPYSAFL